MGRFVGRPPPAAKEIRTPSEPQTPDGSGRQVPKDLNTENAAFVEAYNELFDAEGVALEEYRKF